jgi:hypothetical protein
LALRALLVTQLSCSALMFPILVRTIKSTVVVIVSAWPFALVAAALSSTSSRGAFWAESYVSLWLVALCLWRWTLRSPRSLAIASAASVCLILGDPIGHYLLTDFAAGSSAATAPFMTHFMPLNSCLALLTESRKAGPSILLLSLLLLPPLLRIAKFMHTPSARS